MLCLIDLLPATTRSIIVFLDEMSMHLKG